MARGVLRLHATIVSNLKAIKEVRQINIPVTEQFAEILHCGIVDIRKPINYLVSLPLSQVDKRKDELFVPWRLLLVFPSSLFTAEQLFASLFAETTPLLSLCLFVFMKSRI